MIRAVDLLRTVAELHHFLRQARSGRSAKIAASLGLNENDFFAEVGFVPTMGALHKGHLSLIQRARYENQVLVVSIFVNPLQFSPLEDFKQYPRTLEQDQVLCRQAGVDAIFAPAAEALIPSDVVTQVVPPAAMTEVLCGRSRPGHFQGVATIVLKLLHLVQPDRIYLGQKDAQQLAIVQRLVSDLSIPVEVVPCPIIRETNGLAYSSRNQYLTPEQKEQAAVLYRSLYAAKNQFYKGDRTRQALMKIVESELATTPAVEPEYIELVHPASLAPLEIVEEVGLLAIAARVGDTRLIDNTRLYNRKPIVAIDGPAGAGKSTVTRRVAQALGLLYLDTGAMYRAVTWLVLQSGLEVQDEVAIAQLVSQCHIELLCNPIDKPPQVLINGHEVTEAIRSLEVTAQVSVISAQRAVRQGMVKQQQRYGQQGGIAVEGRDIGTHVFPDAELKIFLSASAQERARRRHQELIAQGIESIGLGQLQRDIEERDRQDSTRNLAPLRKAPDAIEIQTDPLSVAEVTAQIVALYHEQFSENN